MLDKEKMDRLYKVFENVTGQIGIVVTPEMSIDKDLKVNSLTKIQLICAIEDEFEIEIPNSVLKKLKKISDLYSYLEKEDMQ